jgi:RecB family exonuclease
VPISATLVAPPLALRTLAAVIAAAKGPDPLASVTVAVPTNTCGVMTRRALGRNGGIAGVDMVTLNRLAELIAGPALAEAGRSPTSTPVIDLTISSILQADPGPFRAVATHPSTVVALREAHRELRLADPAAVRRLADASTRGRQALRISDAITEALRRDWYDEADLFTSAASSVVERAPAGVRHVVVHLPQELSGRAIEFVRALGVGVDVHVIAQITGHEAADSDARSLVDALGATAVTVDDHDAGDHDADDDGPAGRRVSVVTTTDADEEMREATRLIVDAARSGTPFERIAMLWPSQQPYARLVEHHLTAAEIPWNGRPGTTVGERLVPRFLLDLLDVDRRGLRRSSLFDILADVPLRDDDGEFVSTAAWERVSRTAGVVREDDWNRRLGALRGSERWAEHADAIRTFVARLRDDLGHPSATKSWADWATWCTEQIDRRLGDAALARLDEAEYRAYESLIAGIDRLGHLDPVSAPVTRHRFRTTLEAELDAAPSRRGRVGSGVTVGPLAGAVGLDVDVTIVLGGAEGLLPPRPTSDPLLSDADRTVAGLADPDARSVRLHRLLLASIATSAVTITAPRGDLRSTSSVELSRWIAPWGMAPRAIASHHRGLATTSFPASTTEHRLRGRANDPSAPADAADTVAARGRRLLAGRGDDRLSEFDGDLSDVTVPVLDVAVSPSRLESWSVCPHAYFDHYLLEVDPVEEPGDEISINARDRGTAHHAALDLFHQAVVDGALSQPGPTGWSGEHRTALARFFDDVCEHTERRGRTGRPAFWADERARMLDDLLAWLDRDSELVVERGSVVLASEMRFGTDDHVAIALPDGRRIALRGTVDRVDRTRTGTLVVTDHKSGGAAKFKNLSADNPTADGTLFQLPSYAAAARARFGDHDTPVLAEYGLLRKGNYERPGFLLTPEVDAAVGHMLAHVVAGIETGYFPNLPERPGWRFFVGCWYCEPDGLGTSERWAEWQRKRHDPRLAPWFATAGAADQPPSDQDPA